MSAAYFCEKIICNIRVYYDNHLTYEGKASGFIETAKANDLFIEYASVSMSVASDVPFNLTDLMSVNAFIDLYVY